jgi:hypothetical protein
MNRITGSREYRPLIAWLTATGLAMATAWGATAEGRAPQNDAQSNANTARNTRDVGASRFRRDNNAGNSNRGTDAATSRNSGRTIQNDTPKSFRRDVDTKSVVRQSLPAANLGSSSNASNLQSQSTVRKIDIGAARNRGMDLGGATSGGSTGGKIVIDRKVTNRLIAETKSADTRSVDTKSTNTRSIDTKPADRVVPERRMIERKIPDTKFNALDVKGADTKATDGKTTGRKVIDTQGIDRKTSDRKIIDTKTVDTKAGNRRTINTKAVDTKMIDTKAIDGKTIDRNAIDRKITDRKIGDTKVTLPPSVLDKRTNVDDVRRRLGDTSKTLNRRDHDGTVQSKDLQKLDASKLIKKDLQKLDASKLINTDAGRLNKSGGLAGAGRKGALDAKNMRFSDQLKPGDLDRLTSGEMAKKIKLADQYRLYQKGDVARRLDLEKHGPQFKSLPQQAANLDRFRHAKEADYVYKYHPDFHHGPVAPMYHHDCIPYHYCGPKFFAGLCWYPKWQPWVAWSWNHHHPVVWDPRPFWCRPVVYNACSPWVYWPTPTYLMLPAVECGTWVDVEPVVVAPAATDLQLLAVRFVDPGHPDEKTGPRYRVWFRNNSVEPITKPFNVMLFAANNNRLAADLPQAGVRVTQIEPGAVQSVDIRLPIEVYAMGRDALGKPLPFNTLHILVDANRETFDANMVNNGTRLAPTEIFPVDPAAFEMDPVAARGGQEVVLAGEGFGPEPGQVLLRVGGQELEGEILGWYDLGVRWTLPKIAVAAPTDAEIVLIRGDGAATNPLKITLNP